jgi:quercetin dioxygenase-like cupin family protein
MKVYKFKTIPAISPTLDAHIMHTSETLEVVHLHLEPGQAIAQHINNFDVVMCLIQGKVTIESGDEKLDLETFDTIEIPGGVQRGVINSGDNDARLLLLKKF